MIVLVKMGMMMMSQSGRSRHFVLGEAAGHLLMFMDLESLHVGVVLMSDTLFHCHTMYFRSQLCPSLFGKNTLFPQFGDEKPRSTNLESGSLDVLLSSEMHVLGYTIGL